MENIEIFLKAAAAYGVPQPGLFACSDLFDGRNINMVISTILQVGSEVRHIGQVEVIEQSFASRHVLYMSRDSLLMSRDLLTCARKQWRHDGILIEHFWLLSRKNYNKRSQCQT